MTDKMRPSEEELHAFIDGELDSTRRAAIEAAMRDDAEFAREVRAYSADKARLVQIYGPLIDRPLPQSWLETIANRKVVPISRPPSRRGFVGMAMAASVALIAGGTFVYRRLSVQTSEALIAAAMSAHAGMNTVSSDSVPVTALKDIVGVTVKVPDLTQLGFNLVGLRTESGAGGRGAAILGYRDEDGRIFTLYLKPSPGTPVFEMIKRGETRICLWQDDVLSTVMLADVSAAEMLRLASLAYSGLTA